MSKLTQREAALKAALEAVLAALDAFTAEANWGASALSADTIRQVNEVPGQARAVLAQIER